MEANEDAAEEWTTVGKPTRRRRPQRRRHRDHRREGLSPANAAANASDASDLLQKAAAAARRTSVDPGDSATPEEIVGALNACLRELGESEYWERIRLVLRRRAESERECDADRFRFRSIVCYGIGNFGTKRPSAPMWQLALALMIREHSIGPPTDAATGAQPHRGTGAGAAGGTTAKDAPGPSETRPTTETPPAMYYYEPLMNERESEVLERFGVRVIEENERGKRSVDGGGNGATLFFMPHCPLSLYANVFHTNWDSLRNVVVFGNSLGNYIDGGNVSVASDPQKQQALRILEVLRPFWRVDELETSKRDAADRAAYFERAFNDSSLTSFSSSNSADDDDDAAHWPGRPRLDALPGRDGGEVL